MKYKNKVSSLILSFIVIVSLYYIAYFIHGLEYKIFIIFFTTIASVFYIFAIFEYYEVNEEGLIYVKNLGHGRKEAHWKEINEIFVEPNQLYKVVVINYGMFHENNIKINSELKNYKELIKTVVDKSKADHKVSVDIKVNELLK